MKALYLGLNPPQSLQKEILHYPIIEIVPIPLNDEALRQAFKGLFRSTHLIFTSQQAVSLFFAHLQRLKGQLKAQKVMAVGKATQKRVEQYGYSVHSVPQEETAEGIVTLLSQQDHRFSFFFWPHSARSRPVLRNFFLENHLSFRECILYDTRPKIPKPLPPLEMVDEIIFTSPSTVEAFFRLFGQLPRHKRLTAIGPITKKALQQTLAIC